MPEQSTVPVLTAGLRLQASPNHSEANASALVSNERTGCMPQPPGNAMRSYSAQGRLSANMPARLAQPEPHSTQHTAPHRGKPGHTPPKPGQLRKQSSRTPHTAQAKPLRPPRQTPPATACRSKTLPAQHDHALCRRPHSTAPPASLDAAPPPGALPRQVTLSQPSISQRHTFAHRGCPGALRSAGCLADLEHAELGRRIETNGTNGYAPARRKANAPAQQARRSARGKSYRKRYQVFREE